VTPCEACQAARETNGLWKIFDNRKCPYCAARLIARIPSKFPARRRVILDESIAAGLDEKQIRKLVTGPLPLAPEPERKRK
jgi:hypothetical protein